MKSRVEILRKKSLAEHIPVMRPRTSELLAKIAQDVQPSQVLEIGTCIGLGAITLLLSGAEKVTTIEIDEERYFQAKKNIKEFGLTERCECILGDCKSIIPLMENNRYDLIVLDGPKTFYKDFLPYMKNMLNDGGVVFVDDVDFYGLTEGEELPQRKHRTNVLAIRDFVRTVKSDKEFLCEEYKIEDGVMVLFYRGKGAENQLS